MADTFDPFVANTPFQPSARTLNAWQAAARAHQLGEHRLGGPVVAVPETATEISVQNTSGADVPQFGILQIWNPFVTEAASHATFAELRSMTGISPAPRYPFVITREPIANGYIGKATLLGLTPVQVNVTDTSHAYATCVANDTTKLASSDAGPARIVWVASDSPGPRTTGVQWAMVILNGNELGFAIGEPDPDGAGSGLGSGSGAGSACSAYRAWRVVGWDLNACQTVLGEKILVVDMNSVP